MIPLIALGAIVVVGLLARTATATRASDGDDPHLPPAHPAPVPTPTPEPPFRPVDPAPQPPSPIPPPVPTPPSTNPFIGPPLPPDPRRQDKIARLFVLETEDEPLPPGGQAAIQRRYNMAAEWVRQEVGQHVAYHPQITFLQLPNTSAEIRDIVLSSAARWGENETNNKSGSPLFGTPRRPAPRFAGYDGPTLSARIFDTMEAWAIATGEPLNNPRNPDLIPLQQNWLFIVRGAGGFAGGMPHHPGSRESIGWAICGDSVLSAWLSEGTDEENIAHEVIFVDDTWGRHEWEDGWNGSDIAFPLSLRKRYGTPDAQTGSFIHETFHAIFAAIHVSQPDIDELPAGDPRRAIWAADPVDNIMGGSHLDWPTTKAKIHAITLNEMDDVDYWI